MSRKKSVLRPYVENNVHVSISVMALVVLTYRQSDMYIDWYYLFFAGLATICLYTYTKVIPQNIPLIDGLRIILKKSPIWAHVAGLLALCLSWTFNSTQWLLLFGLSLLSLWYVLPQPVGLSWIQRDAQYKMGNVPLRSYGAFKILIVALVWSGVSVILPLLSKGPLTMKDWSWVVEQTLWIVVLTIPFDIRDHSKDQLIYPTWPQKFGMTRTKLFGLLLLIVIVVLHLLRIPFDSESLDTFYLILILSALALWGARPNQSFWYSAFWVESIPIFWCILDILIRP